MTDAGRHLILIVDDEPDIASVTKLSLRGLSYAGKRLEFEAVATGRDAVEFLRARPDVGVMLLDVVMETNTAGLDACRAIREELKNRFVRILLRTGQPGVAPERKTIEEYDIDGYLPKAELTSNRLYAAVRAALKSYDELVELERHRRVLALVHESVVSLHSFEPLESALHRVLATAVSIAPASLAILRLGSFESEGSPREWTLHLSTDDDATVARSIGEIARQVASSPEAMQGRGPASLGDGLILPLRLHRGLGGGWIYLRGASADQLALQALALLAAHAENALYSAVAQDALTSREGPFYDSLIV